LAKLGFFANSLVQRICQQLRPMLLANQAVGKVVVLFANRTLPTAVASLLAKVTSSELTASPFANGTHGC
jgi:calcineurin-like phosphoesterase